MNACASLGPLPVAAAGAEPTMVVLIDGVPEPSLLVREVSIEGPLDRRAATLELAGVPRARLEQREITVALFARLSDEQVRAPVLVRGGVDRERHERSARAAGDEVRVVDRWASSLDRQLPAVWWRGSGGAVVEGSHAAEFGVGAEANRAADPARIAGRDVHPLQRGGAPWTLGQALETLLAFAGITASTRLIPADVASLLLAETIRLDGTVGDALAALLGPHGLGVRRETWLESGRPIERAAIVPEGRGGVVRLGWADAGRPITQVRRAAADSLAPIARAWIARARGAEVESTFTLVAGWDPALEGEAEAVYERGGASFASYANAYRLWALNEDGRFSEPPFSRGPAYDLALLLGEPFVRPRPLRLGACLTLDDGGARREPIVEVSLDSGATWSTYGGNAVIQSDHAAVYLDDAVLPPAFLAAAKANTARVRVTATLRSPNPIETLRWRGNPFGCVGEPRVFELGGAFAVRRVAGGSVHHAGVRDGSLAADEIDQRLQMDAWLMHRQGREALAGDPERRATVELPGLWPLLRAGDWLRSAGANERDAAQRSEHVDAEPAVVRAMRLRTPARGGSVTSIGLTFLKGNA